MKKLSQKGFTLAELLIVVAIIAVLVAVSIPVFTAQLEKSREETDIANLRSAYAIASADALSGSYKSDKLTPGTFTGNGSYSKGADGVYYAYYNVKEGKLSNSPANSTGKGTTAEGKCEDHDGPLFYKTTTKANGHPMVVVIVENGGVADHVFAGFTKNNPTPSSFSGASSEFALQATD